MLSSTQLGFLLADLMVLSLVLLLIGSIVLQRRRQELPSMATSGNILVFGLFVAAVADFLVTWHLSRSGFSPEGVAATGAGLISWTASRLAMAMAVIGVWLASRQSRDAAASANLSLAKVAAAENSAMQAEERFRNLFETTTNSVFCFTFETPMPIALPIYQQSRRMLDGVLTECNAALARELGEIGPEQILGRPVASLPSSKDSRAFGLLVEDFVLRGYRLTDYELEFKSSNGDEQALLVSLTGIVKDDLLHKVWGVATNVRDSRETQKELLRRRQFEKVMSAVSARLVMAPGGDRESAIVDSLREVCEYLGGNRIAINWGSDVHTPLDIMYRWQHDNAVLINHLSSQVFPYLSRLLFKGEHLVVSDVADLPQAAAVDRDRLLKVGMKSFVMMPFRIDGVVMGVMSLGNDVDYCDWSDQDIDDFRLVTDMIANYVHRLRQRRQLDQAMADLRKASDRLHAENVYLRGEIKVSHNFDSIVGESRALRGALRLVEQVADTMTPVLILGETGTGKELVAHALHEHSARQDRPLVKVNCAALPANLIESELFGYEKGAFTSADTAKKGRFDLADGSTLFLDEIGEIPVALQAKLLRVLQEGEFERLGGTETVKVDVRIIAATNRNLQEACSRGEFRTDLYYRINAFPIELPPLRMRGDDIQLLAEHFAAIHAARLGREVTEMSADMVDQLRRYSWPGNVRELEGVVQRAMISSSGSVLELSQILAENGSNGMTAADDLRSVERDHIVGVLEKCRWKIAGGNGAAAMLDLPPSTLRSKMQKLGIERPL